MSRFRFLIADNAHSLSAVVFLLAHSLASLDCGIVNCGVSLKYVSTFCKKLCTFSGFALPRSRQFPGDPEQLSEVAADVNVLRLKLARSGIEFEVLPPAAQQSVELVDHLEEAPTSATPEDAAQYQLELLEALAAVDLQLERLLDELDRVFQHAFPCAPRLHVDIAVVGVSAEL